MSPGPTRQAADDVEAVRVAILKSPEPLLTAFNAEIGLPRLMVLVSPTCPVCLDGVRIVETTLRALAPQRVAVEVVWLPVLEGDDLAAALLAGAAFASYELVEQFWDGERLVSREVHGMLGLDRFDRAVAWDLYLLYGRDARWSLELPIPRLWMQQLRIEEVPELDQALLHEQLSGLIAPEHWRPPLAPLEAS